MCLARTQMIYYVHTKDSPYPYQSKGLLHVRDEKTEAEKEKATKNSLRSHVEPCILWGCWLCTLSSKPHHSPRTMHTKTVPPSSMAPFPQLHRVLLEFCSFSQGPPDIKAMDFWLPNNTLWFPKASPSPAQPLWGAVHSPVSTHHILPYLTLP